MSQIVDRFRVDFASIEASLQRGPVANHVIGVASLLPGDVNLQFPHTLSQVGEKLGDVYWHRANELIKQIQLEKGIYIKGFDNCYHVALKTGRSAITHKYSDAAVSLLQAVRSGQAYELDPTVYPPEAAGA